MPEDISGNSIGWRDPWVITHGRILNRNVFAPGHVREVDEHNVRIELWHSQIQEPTDVIVTGTTLSKVPQHYALARFVAEPFGE